MHAFITRRAGTDAAGDLLGEVFRVAFVSRERYDANRPDAAPWLYGIAFNVIRQYHRAEGRQRRTAAKVAAVDDRGVHRDHDVGVVDAVVAAGRVRDLSAAIAALSEPERDTLLLYAWEELSYDEIAVALDVPTGTVRSRLNRARMKLRDRTDQPATIEEQPRNRGYCQ